MTGCRSTVPAMTGCQESPRLLLLGLVLAGSLASLQGRTLGGASLESNSPGSASLDTSQDQLTRNSAEAGSGGPQEPSDPVTGLWVEHISWEPRTVVYHNFLTPEECDHLLALGSPHVEPSMVVNSSGEFLSEARTSSGAFLLRSQDDIVRRIENRIALFTHIPAGNGEALYVMEYKEGQEYKAHLDLIHVDEHNSNGGHRIATMLMYLTNVEEGGETAFPSVPAREGAAATGQGWSECAHGKLAVKPHKGDALLFWSVKPDFTTVDEASLHAGCPVTKGVKWSATKWMREATFYDDTNHHNKPQSY